MKWTVCKYFDDHFEKIVSTHDTKQEAIEARNKLKPGAYISYEVREADEWNVQDAEVIIIFSMGNVLFVLTVDSGNIKNKTQPAGAYPALIKKGGLKDERKNKKTFN